MRIFTIVVALGLTLYSHLTLAVPGNASILSTYLSDLKTSIKLNREYKCHYSGFRWKDAYFADAYDQRTKKYYKIKEYSQYYWAEVQDKETLEKEIASLSKRISKCEKRKNEPYIPYESSSLQHFIPKDWKQLTAKSYVNQFQKIPSGFIDYMPKPSSSEDTISVDLNNDNTQDVVTFIGRSTSTNIGFDDFRLMILLGKNTGGFRLENSILAELDDMPPEGGLASIRKYSFNVSQKKNISILYIKNTIWNEQGIGDRWVQFGFSYRNKQLLLVNYTEFSRNLEYGSTPEDKYFKRTFDFLNKSVLIESSMNTTIDACILSRKQQIIARKNCPKPTSEHKNLYVPESFKLAINEFENFNPIDFEKSFGIKVND